jgi:Fic family protein
MASPVGQLQRIRGFDQALKRDFDHFAFVPHPLSSDVELEHSTHKAASDAMLALGRLDFAVRRLPNPSLLVRPALRREAQSTSALEGTYATLAEVLEADFVDEAHLRAEVREVMNYVRAAERSLDLIQIKPICITILCELQDILVRGTRGDTFDRGRLREGQVYIGERRRGIEASRFVPPPGGDVLRDGVGEWEKWVNEVDDLPLIVKVAMAHYQFETLHPFSDGNGRLGRLVATLQLITAKALVYPVLNLSPWLEDRKDEYKTHLLDVSKTGDFNPWVTFFSEAVIAQASAGVRRIERLHDFREGVLKRLGDAKVRGVAINIADSLLGYPFITPAQAARMHGVTYPPANRAILKLVELGILREFTGRSYGRVFACDEVLSLMTDDLP